MKGVPLNTSLNSASTGRSCFLMVDMNPRVLQKFSAPFSLRNVPEIFCFSFIMRRSRSAWLLVKGTVKSLMNLRISSWYFRHRSRRFFAFDCFFLPRFPGSSGGSEVFVSSSPILRISWYRSSKAVIASGIRRSLPFSFSMSTAIFISLRRSSRASLH